MEFIDEDLDEQDDQETLFRSSSPTPHRIKGKGKVVYWRNCPRIALYRGKLRLREVSRDTGKGLLPENFTLYFLSDGGQAREE